MEWDFLIFPSKTIKKNQDLQNEKIVIWVPVENKQVTEKSEFF